MKFLYKFLLYCFFVAFILYLSYYCTLFTISFLPFSTRLIHLTSATTISNNQFRNLLFTNLISARPSTFKFINLSIFLPLIVARKVIPPFDKLCHKIGNVFNFLKNKSLNRSADLQLNEDNVRNMELPSFAEVEQESQQWSLDSKNPNFKNHISLRTLNFVGCLIFILIFVIYLFIFSSLFVFFLDRIIQSVDNIKVAFEKMNPSLITADASKELPAMNTTSNTKNNKFNSSASKTYNVDFIEY